LHRDLVWQQAAPLLDFLVADVAPDGKPLMITLEPRQVISYRLENGSWRPDQTFRIPVPDHRPRDIRGMIESANDLFWFNLSDVQCEGAARREFEINCVKSREHATGESEPWPLRAGGEVRGDALFETDRNYFQGFVSLYGESPDLELPPFFSAAIMNRKDWTNLILTELDGKARLYENSSTPAATYTGWGDDVVSIATGCTANWQVLATGTGDWTERDHLQAYEPDHASSPTGVSESLEFSGPILSLWPSLDGKAARVVSKNLQTGLHEASIVTVACGE
jgi:hypothetical protein